MMKHFVIAIFTTLALLLVPVSVFATDVISPACKDIPDSTVCKENKATTGKNPLFGKEGILTKTTSILGFLLGIISVIMIIVSGIRFAVSQGEPSKVNSARNAIIYSVVGIVVAVMAQSIVLFVLDKL